MGKKGGKSYSKKDIVNANTSSRRKHDSFSSDEMDDEIDAFHKPRDIVPLDVNDDSGESDEDDELPIFYSKDIDNDEDEDEDGDEDDDGDDDHNVAKILRTSKHLNAKFGGGEDEMQDDDDGEEEDHELTLGGKRNAHGADNRNFEQQSSDDEAPKEEEEAALQMQRKKAESLTMEDYDLVEGKVEDKSNLKDASDKGNREMKSPDRDITFKAENLNALSKEEQMKVVYRSSPELVDWLSELNEAHKLLECKINPFLSKVQKGEIVMEGAVRYFELKKLLLLSYCQAITFYLLLKSEGHPVHDHPVVARLAEIKELLDQIEQLDAKLPVGLEDILQGSNGLETVVNSENESAPITIDSITRNQELPLVSAESPEEAVPSKDGVPKARKVKQQKDHIGVRSLEMLKVRASLEAKWKEKGLYSDTTPEPSTALKRSRPVNGQLETHVFDDDAVGPARLSEGLRKSNLKKRKVISGDDDLPKKDDIGERRRKHELRVLAGAGVKSGDDDDDGDDDHGSPEDGAEERDVEKEDSENEFYEQVQNLHAAKLAAKAEIYTRKSAVSSLSEETIDGKRHISSQMEKNRGLTRIRNKDKKNPRKNYRNKHQKAVKNRKGQVQSIKRPTAPYGGESTGINASISRSVRL